ncbi:MAG: LPP20 family lipoprotein [Campylobacterales bacterium]|nr:LPP20 family lipoprotein [Campylobacterales bacterium]
MKRVTFMLLSLFFMGCSGAKQPEVLSYPSWYLNPPHNDGSSLYGVGEGVDLSSAKISALNAIAASLSVTVSSEFKKSESSSSFNGRENTYHSAINTLKAEVKEIEFGDYTVVQNLALSGRIILLVEVSRSRLFNAQKAKLEQFSKELRAEHANISRKSPLQQAFAYEQSMEKTQKLTALALLAKSINSNFDTAPYIDQVAQIKQYQEDALGNAKVSVTADPEARVFVDALKEGLNDAGIQTVSSGANTHIHLQNSFQTDVIYGFTIVKATLLLSTKDAQQRNIATKTISLNGKSRYDAEKAKLSAAQSLSLKITQEGIYALIGIQ